MSGIKNEEKLKELLDDQPLTLGDALILMMAGYKMRRGTMNNIRHIAIQKPDENSKMRKSYLYAVTNDGSAVPYCLQNDDIFINDWVKAE